VGTYWLEPEFRTGLVGARGASMIFSILYNFLQVSLTLSTLALLLMIQDPLPIYVSEGLKDQADERPPVVTLKVKVFSFFQDRLKQLLVLNVLVSTSSCIQDWHAAYLSP
jgi:hypothetical protein